jgi:putative pyruvate formate lyase activating enzyme
VDEYPGYRACGEERLRRTAAELTALLADCTVCPHHCHVNRLAGELGYCRGGREAELSGYGPHFGEERPLVGRCGSGTIFFSHCNLGCVYCQNWDTSHGAGDTVSAAELAAIMLGLQAQGCHNINLVTPSHYVPQIAAAAAEAAGRGLAVPLVYNSGGYDEAAVLARLAGIVDIYMPDFKYADAAAGERLSCVREYPAVARAALREMHRQVGDLEVGADGVARRGLIIRHLVLPGGLAGTEEVLRFVAAEISPRSYLNIMDQYHPAFKAGDHPDLGRPVTAGEYRAALAAARRISPAFRLAE